MAISKLIKKICMIFLLLIFFASCATVSGEKSRQGRSHEPDFEKESLEWAHHLGF